MFPFFFGVCQYGDEGRIRDSVGCLYEVLIWYEKLV